MIKSIDELKEWTRNPREIGESALAGLKVSLEEFGDLSGIVFNVRFKALVCGHQRIKALKEKYGEDIKVKKNVIHLPNGEVFPIRLVDWDETKHAAANVAANSQRLAGSFTDELAALLDELQEGAPALSQALNFDALRIDFEQFWKLNETVEDEAPPLPKVAKTKAGDLYQLGGHRLLCGDCTKAEDLEKLMGGKKAVIVFTDPPYNVDYESQTGNSFDSSAYGGDGKKILNDNNSEEDCLSLYTAALKTLMHATTDTATIYWWFANRNNYINRLAFKQAGWKMSQIIIWLKTSFVFSYGQEYHRCYEPCMIGWKEGKTHFSTKTFNSLADVFSVDKADFQDHIDVWYEKRDFARAYVHPTQKPVRLAERALKKNSRITDLCLDIFGGSGSTLIACQQLNRVCYSLELDPKFCDVIVTRYVNFTQNPQVIRNGKAITWTPGEEK